MTLLPDKHIFTIWQGATFFEVLTLYETNDQTQPRDFYTSTSVTGITVSPNGTTNVTLSVASGNINAKLAANTKYYISSPNIPAANGVYFTTPSSISSGLTYNATLYQNLSPSANGIGNGTNEVAIITKRTINYGAEMIIRDKPQGTSLLTLSTVANGGSITNGIHPSDIGCSIVLPDNPNVSGQIQLIIADTKTATLGTSSTWKTGVYDLTLTEILNPVTNGVTTDALLYGGIKVAGV
jgi:hypothetical protein